MAENYLSITPSTLVHFKLTHLEGKVQLQKGRNTITLNNPFILNEKVASFAGMMGDASLIKDLRRLYFSQKKDIAINYQFKTLLEEIFQPDNTIFIRYGHNAFDTYTNSMTLAYFLYLILDFTKSDEEMRVPRWVFQSPTTVKMAYLKEAFAMEGTIFKSLKEIRFISKDYHYAKDIHGLLASVGISSFLKSRIGGTHRTIQYRVSIYRKENFTIFKEIGVNTPLHRERFFLLCQKYGL